MEGLCLTLIESKAMVLLAMILFVSILGVALHIWLTRRLAFVDFEEEEPLKKEYIRLFLPMGLIVVVCIFLPMIMIWNSVELQDCLVDPDVRMFVLFPWNVIMPAIGWVTTIMVNAILGAVSYFGIGFVIWWFTRR